MKWLLTTTRAKSWRTAAAKRCPASRVKQKKSWAEERTKAQGTDGKNKHSLPLSGQSKSRKMTFKGGKCIKIKRKSVENVVVWYQFSCINSYMVLACFHM